MFDYSVWTSLWELLIVSWGWQYELRQVFVDTSVCFMVKLLMCKHEYINRGVAILFPARFPHRITHYSYTWLIVFITITNHASRLVFRNDPDLKWLPQSMYYA